MKATPTSSKPMDQVEDTGRLVVIVEATSHTLDIETGESKEVDSYTIAGRVGGGSGE